MNSRRVLPRKSSRGGPYGRRGDHSNRSERLEEHAYRRGGIWILDIYDKSRRKPFRTRFPMVDIIEIKRFLGNTIRRVILFFLQIALAVFERKEWLF